MVCTSVSVVCESNDGKCVSLWNSPLDICTKAGYNYTLPLPEQFNEGLQKEFGHFVTIIITKWHNCTTQSLAAAMECSYMFPKCSVKGERVYPCKRVCGEFLKQCMNTSDWYRDLYMDSFLSLCLILPDEQPNGDNCFEPPNFTTDDSVKSECFKVLLKDTFLEKRSICSGCRSERVFYRALSTVCSLSTSFFLLPAVQLAYFNP